MLLTDFYKIIKTNITDKGFSTQVKLNTAHEVFNGHFPENPVVPGVCMIQMISELLSDELSVELFLTKAGNIKFKSVVLPEKDNNLFFNYEIVSDNSEVVSAKCEITNGESVCMSFKGEFKKMN